MLKKIIDHRKTSVAVVVLMVAALTVWVGFSNQHTKATAKITEGTAKTDTVAVSVENDGVITTDKAVLNFSQSGVIKNVAVKVGDTVSKGDVLAELDSAKLDAQVDQAQSTYSANLEKARRLAPDGEEVVLKQRALDAAKSALAAEQNIYNDVVAKYSTGSSQELAEVAKLKKAEADVASAEAQLALTMASRTDAQYVANASYASLQIAKTAVYDTKITAPFDGIITSINGVAGQIAGGTQAGSAGFITIANPGSAVLVSNFDEEDIAKIKVGQPIKAEFSALNATLNGQVVFVSPVAKLDQNGTASYEVRSSFVANTANVLDGMSATIKFITKSVDKAVVIPNKAVKLVNGESMVSFYNQDKTIATKKITTGFTDGKSVAVTNGLQAGEQYLIIE